MPQILHRYLIMAVLLVATSGLLVLSCVSSTCYENVDCDEPQVCDTATGNCVYECRSDSDCSPGFACVDHRCIPAGRPDGDDDPEPRPLVCPEDMAPVADTFCVDLYEASRPDASESSAGMDDSRALSVVGVIPWQVADNAAAAAACEAAGKRLCSPQEWRVACRGPQDTHYSYGNAYDPLACNGIDAFGRSDFHIVPTGSFPDCTNGWGVFDINGNLWEHVAEGSDQTVRGGAYNCSDSATLHHCDYIPGTWAPSARGFRCCLSKGAYEPDGDEPDPDGELDGDLDTDTEDGGCLPDPDGDETPPDGDDPQEDGDLDIDEDGDLDVDEDGDLDTDDEQETETPGSCPPDMARVGAACMDRYEASRPDATESNMGSDTSHATSRAGVMPWFPVNLTQARAACTAAGKRLCTLDEWVFACSGPENRAYSYGNAYSADTCNGIDAFCNCDAPACADAPVCPYPHCRSTCGANFRAMPTGSFPSCTTEHGLYDVTGNVWELVDTDDGLEHFRGGAYNCGDSEALHRCDYDATWGPSAKGFRCCKDPEVAR